MEDKYTYAITKKAKGETASEKLIAAMETEPIISDDTKLDIAQDMSRCVLEELSRAIEVGQREYKSRDFYIEMYLRQYTTLPGNHVKPVAIVVPLCPTPTHDHIVWKIHGGTGTEEYLWNVPSVKDGLHLIRNQKHLTKEDQALFDQLCLFMDGTLRKRAKKLNGEI
jgi:hypothetical protein